MDEGFYQQAINDFNLLSRFEEVLLQEDFIVIRRLLFYFMIIITITIIILTLTFNYYYYYFNFNFTFFAFFAFFAFLLFRFYFWLFIPSLLKVYCESSKDIENLSKYIVKILSPHQLSLTFIKTIFKIEVGTCGMLILF